jgi:hypothetical protein
VFSGEYFSVKFLKEFLNKTRYKLNPKEANLYHHKSELNIIAVKVFFED